MALIRRFFPWARLVLVAQAAVAAKSHWDRLTPDERGQFQRIVRKSRGRPSNLTARERTQLRDLVRKLELPGLGRDLAALFTPMSRRGRKR